MKTKDEIQNGALEIIGNNKRCSVEISVGVGKTKLGLMWLNKYYFDDLKVLIIAPKLAIFESWKNDAIKFDMPYLIGHIKFVTYLSLEKEIPDDYHIIIGDEIHSITPNCDFWFSQYSGMILGLTGTAPKSKWSEKYKLIDKFCPIIYRYKTETAIEDEILNDYKIEVYTLELDSIKNIKKNKKDGSFWYSSETSEYSYWCNRIEKALTAKDTQLSRIMRMKALMGFKSKELLAKKLFDLSEGKCILFCNTIEQADKLSKYSYHSKNSNSEENLTNFKKGNILKLAAIQQLSEGINIPNLTDAIIMHSFSGDSPKSRQKIGRILRLSVDKIATVKFLVFKNTIDEEWTRDVLKHFNLNKITWI